MKKKQFNVFLQEEIDKIRLTIDNLNTLKSKLRNEAELLAQDPNTRNQLLDEYYKNKKRGDEPLFCALLLTLIPEKLFHAVVDSSDKSVVINTVALLPHKIFKFGSEVLGNANSTSKVFNNNVDIFGDERTIIFLNSKNIFVRHRNHIGNGTIVISFIFFTSGGGFLLSRFHSNKIGAAAVIPFK
jgi:hypothetical protein